MKNAAIRALIWIPTTLVTIGLPLAFVVWGMPLDAVSSISLAIICAAAGIELDERAIDKFGTKQPITQIAERLLEEWTRHDN